MLPCDFPSLSYWTHDARTITEIDCAIAGFPTSDERSGYAIRKDQVGLKSQTAQTFSSLRTLNKTTLRFPRSLVVSAETPALALVPAQGDPSWTMPQPGDRAQLRDALCRLGFLKSAVGHVVESRIVGLAERTPLRIVPEEKVSKRCEYTRYSQPFPSFAD